MINKTYLIENVIDRDTQDNLEYIMFQTLFPWFYRSNFTESCDNIFGYDYNTVPGFAHVFSSENGAIGNFLEYTLPIIEGACGALDIEQYKILNARTFLQMPHKTPGLTIPHIDMPTTEHIVILYYVLDSDGDTVLFDKTHDLSNKQKKQDPLLEADIFYRSTPKKGNALVFHGSNYHSHFLPVKNMRCVINFNLDISNLAW